MAIQINRATDALIIIDLQNDFCPGGSLAVAGGDEIITDIDNFARKFDEIIPTVDWHPDNHSSFAVNQHDIDPFQNFEMPYGTQTAWPKHCVQNTHGAAIHTDLKYALTNANMIIRKGYRPEVDSYSAFFENDQTTKTGLAGYLRDKEISRIFLVGLAYDFCVGFSALDGIKEGFEVTVVKNMTRAIDLPTDDKSGTVIAMENKFHAAGVNLIEGY